MHIDQVGFKSVAFSPDGTLLATGSADDTVRLWRAPELPRELTRKTPEGRAAALFTAAGGRDPSEKWSTLRSLALAGDWEKILAVSSNLMHESPGDAFLWHDRGWAYANLHQHETAIADYTRALALQPRYAEAWRGRGGSYVATGQLERAWADFARLAELQPEDVIFREELALTQLATGRSADYRRLCADLLDRFGSAGRPSVANNVAWCCSLGPAALGDLKPVLKLARRVTAQRRNAENLNTLGAALYRSGEFEEAIRTLKEAVAGGKEHGSAWDFLFLAMTHARLGHTGEAQRLLARVGPWVEAHLRPVSNSDLPAPLSWQNQLELRLLRREAEAVVAGHTPPEQALTEALP